jgi:hypothetical protein
MKLLQVTIGNCDGQFMWLFNSEFKMGSVLDALADLRNNRGIAHGCSIVTSIPDEKLLPDAIGLLLAPGCDLDEAINDKSTYWIFVDEYETGTIFTGRSFATGFTLASSP